MNTIRPTIRLRQLLNFAAFCFFSLVTIQYASGQSSQTGTVTVGAARFTVITPYLIRMEYQPSGQFVDLPSLFAAERGKSVPPSYKLMTLDGFTTISTSALTLTYLADGKPFDSTNLTVTVTTPSLTTKWVPGLNDPLNLGGTLRTVDGVTGPRDLGQGVLSRSGWAVVDDTQSDLLTPDGWVASRPDAQKSGIDWYFFGYGQNYRAALSSLTTISGSVPMPRRYAMGVWYSRYWPWSEDDYKSIVTRYGSEGFPLDNVVLDMDWHKDGWTGWSWNTKLLPDAPGLLTWFHSQGLHDTVNLHPADGVAPYEDQYSPFMKAMSADPASQATIPFDAGSKQYMNALFTTVLDPLKENGVDFWWLDWQQYPYTRSVGDLTNLFWLNTLLYDYTAEDGQRGMSFSRWGGWGDQRHPIHFSGDANTGFPMLAFEVPFTSTAGNVGCFFWSHDIGGHMGGRNEESYARWCQFGATAPVLRSHSTRDATTDRAPWNYPKWAEDSMRVSFHLRSELFPYIYTSAQQACAQSIPLDRPVYLDLPNHEESYHNGQEFLLGSNILVAPIASAGAGVGHVAYQTVWYPPTSSGYWYNIMTGERAQQQTTALAAGDIDEFPIYARGGVPIPMQPYTPRMGTTQVSTLRVRCYPGGTNQFSQSSLYEDDGVTTQYQSGKSATTTISYSRTSAVVRVAVSPVLGKYSGQPALRGYSFEFPDVARPTKVRVNGAVFPVSYNPSTFMATVNVRPLQINRQIVIDLMGYRPTGWNQLHQLAAQRRLAETGDTVAQGTTQNLNAILTAATSTAEQTAALAAVGVGLDHKNIAPTFFPESYQDTLYVPYGIVDGNVVTLPDGSKMPVGPSGISGYPVTAPPGKHLRVSLVVAGQSYVLPPLQPGIGSDDNIAPSAVVTASSVQLNSGSQPGGATDGVIGGYPGSMAQEWASNAETTGAWIRLDWNAPKTIDQVWLYDRLNLDDQVLAGTITFSDGSSEVVGALPNDASKPAVVTFPAKTITWLKFTITQTSTTTQNVGLSEIAVFNAGAKVKP